jgi:hypothetical protein
MVCINAWSENALIHNSTVLYQCTACKHTMTTLCIEFDGTGSYNVFFVKTFFEGKQCKWGHLGSFSQA